MKVVISTQVMFPKGTCFLTSLTSTHIFDPKKARVTFSLIFPVDAK